MPLTPTTRDCGILNAPWQLRRSHVKTQLYSTVFLRKRFSNQRNLEAAWPSGWSAGFDSSKFKSRSDRQLMLSSVAPVRLRL